MFKSGFFNSKLGEDGKGDRAYDAEDIAAIFDGIISDGIIKNFGDAFSVAPNGGSNVMVGTGRAWHNHTWSWNVSSMILTLAAADSSLDRVDAIVLEINKTDSVRANSIKVITGTPSSEAVRPTLIKDIDVQQYPLAYIRRRAGITDIAQSDVDVMVGTSECPYAMPIIDDVALGGYYTKTQTDALLSNKSDNGHNHNTDYYTKNETCSKEEITQKDNEVHDWAVGEINNVYDEMDIQIENLRSEITGVANNASADIAALRSDLSSDISDVQNLVNTLNTRVDSIYAELDDRISSLGKRVKALEDA